MPAPAALIAELRARVGAIECEHQRKAGVLPFGVPALDAALPDRGLRLGALHEIAEGGGGPGWSHAAAATLFTAAIAARLPRPTLWVTPARDLFAPGLAGVGLTPDRLILVEAANAKGVLALVEEGLRCPALACVVGEVRGLALPQSRRLQLAAEASGVTAFVLRRWAKDEASSAAMTRWRISAHPSEPLGVPGIGPALWRVELMRCRGAEGASFIMEAPDDAGRLALVPDLPDRSLPDRPAAHAA